MEFNKGDILEGVKTVHPIAFLKKINEETFEGCMLTHAPPNEKYDNIELKEEHFVRNKEDGTNYKVTYDKTYFVKARLLKEGRWGPFKIEGRLSENGIKYLEDKLDSIKPINWHFYKGKYEDNNN